VPAPPGGIPVSITAPWRLALYEAILQRKRREKSRKESRSPAGPRFVAAVPPKDLAAKEPTAPGITPEDLSAVPLLKVGKGGTPGLSAVTDIVVDAPLRFDAKEFLIYMYTCLCKAVLADVRFTTRKISTKTLTGRLLGSILLPRAIGLRALAGSLVGICFGFLAVGLGWEAYGGGWPMPWHDPQAWAGVGAVACAMLAVGSGFWRSRRALQEVQQSITLADDAGGEAAAAALPADRQPQRLLVKDGKILTAMITPPFVSPTTGTTPGPGHGTEAAAVRSRR
jgi:hypothetical protein